MEALHIQKPYQEVFKTRIPLMPVSKTPSLP